ncbi:MAG TPA: hypothetical protein VHZ74_02805 [Bryobacteraceae bacterium]|nr:hypothetical protein [Bryobacteraceae bacterium]
MRFLTANARKASGWAGAFLSIIALAAGSVYGQSAAGSNTPATSAQLTVSQASISWKRVAGTTIDLGLAGAASGPVVGLWYAGDTGGGLLVQTESGRVFETADFVHWRLNTVASPRLAGSVTTSLLPEPGAKVQAAGARFYAVGTSNVYASDDNGKTWLNLTGFNNRSVIGGGFTALAVALRNPQEISAANRFGVWRSLDGGLSWRGLNENLPNLMVRRLADRRTAVLADGTLASVEGGSWTPIGGSDAELALRARLGATVHADLTAAALAGTTAYAGTATGRLLASHDNGGNWREAPLAQNGGITRIWVDPDRPDTALAAAGTRLLRTVNGGQFWDEVTGALPSAQIHGIAADRSAGVVYLATDRGVFSGNLSLNDAGAADPNWKAISGDLPAAPAWDVRLNTDNTLTVALDGYGVFEAPAPHRTRNVRIVSGADLTERPAAPGSLISVLGAKVEAVRNDGVTYPVLASSDQSSQLQVPFEATPGTFSLTLHSAGEQGSADSWSLPLTVKDAAPAIFVDGEGAPLLLDSASGLVLDSKTAVNAGSTVEVLATGLGKVTPEWRTGVPAPLDAPPAVSGTVTAFLDGRPIEVTRAVLAPDYVGYYLVELAIPAIVNRGASELRIVMNGVESNRVKLFLEPNLPSQ